MNPVSSRRRFLAAGMALPTAGAAATSGLPFAPAAPPAPQGGSPKLTYKVLGRTGLKVTTVGFGCMITSDPSVISMALDLGINLFDTARIYQGGNNERMVGNALKSKRKEIVLCSKARTATKDSVLKELETSLRELQTDYLDIWHLHSKNAPGDLTDDLMEAQRIARQQGKIRFAGVSLHSGHAEMIPRIVKTGHFDVLLVSYNFTMGGSADPLLAQAHQAGIGIVGMKVMAGGYRVMPFYPTQEATRNMLRKEGALLAALKWVLKNPNVDTTIPSMVDMDELQENMAAMSSAYTPADEKLLAARLELIRPLHCRMCGACAGLCPKGLPVCDMLRILTYADGYRQFPMARERFLELDERVRNVRCADCPECAVRCPNGVDVAGRLRRAQELFT
jgi:hypothetical protein